VSETQDSDSDINFCLQFWTENHVLNLHPKELIWWGSMAASQCHSWWRWSDTLWVTLARLWLHMFSVVRLELTQQLPLKWFCGVFFPISFLIYRNRPIGLCCPFRAYVIERVKSAVDNNYILLTAGLVHLQRTVEDNCTCCIGCLALHMGPIVFMCGNFIFLDAGIPHVMDITKLSCFDI
jgi:hypothetical protein